MKQIEEIISRAFYNCGMAELFTLTQCAVIWMRHSICQRDLRDEKKSHAYDAKHIETYVIRKGDHCRK